MKPKLILGLALFLLVPFRHSSASEPSTSRPPQKLVHHWQYITFPWTLPDGKQCPSFTCGYDENVRLGFRLDIMGIVPELFKTNVITARLYRADGEIVEPTGEGKKLLNVPISINTATRRPGIETPSQVMTFFPWGTNALEESWIEVTMGTERYWVEIPYGFDRNPADPLPPSFPGGPPRFISALKSLTVHDHVLRWETVHYDLGEIQNGWRLSLIQSNSLDAESEVVLYREDVKIGTATSWGTDSPATTLRVLNGSGAVIGSHGTDFHIQDGGMERSNRYDIAHNGDEQRCWGQIEISVDNQTYRVIVPSSIYKFAHGHASAN